MKKLAFLLVYFALLAGCTYAAFVWGWNEGVNRHAVMTSLADTRVSLSAAESLRADDAALALEVLDANLSWMHSSLLLDPEVPEDQRGTFETVMRRLEAYRSAHGRSGAR